MHSFFYASSRLSGRAAPLSRLFVLTAISLFCFGGIVVRLFQLQLLHNDAYLKIAKEQHFGAITLPARRGEILVRDTHSGELSKLATNTTLDLLYVDPFVLEDKVAVAHSLAPLLFTEQEYKDCIRTPEDCRYNVIESGAEDTLISSQPVWNLGVKADIRSSSSDQQFKSYEELVREVEESILNKISKSEVDFTILRRSAEKDLIAAVINEQLPGIFADPKRFMVYADPTLIPEGRLFDIAKTLSVLLNDSASSLEKQLARRKVRYVFLKNRLDPDISRQIRGLNLKGVVLIPEHWRYYPESNLASHIIGFLNRDGVGQYGIEGFFNTDLEGKKGKIYAESDPFGRQITVGNSRIVNAVDGDTIVLTIDRIVQKRVESILAENVEKFRADSGQVIVMDPFTGAIVAMANYPTFDPNNYNDAYALRPLQKDEVVYKTTPLFMQNEKGQYVPASEDDVSHPEIQKFVFKNRFGPAVFKNKVVSEFYEPGSVFKPIVMSVALDVKEVDPQTTFMDNGPLKIDEFEIKNSTNQYYGKTTMTQVLELSLNTGMSFVAKQLGKKLLYKYLKDFGFGQYTNIQLEGESNGRLDHYNHWSKAQLLTTSFGQGIIVTPLQMIAAWASLANGGKLVQPYIVESVIREDQVVKTEPQIVQRVISEETSSIITSMLISAVRRGYGKKADVPGYLVAGKTGTSQIAGADGKYEKGEGAVVTSFAGYLPALQPKFIMLVKFDRPRIGDNAWGENTAAPTFRQIADFLIDYYHIQPNE